MEFFSTRNKILSINPNGLRSTSIQLRERIWNVFYKEEYDYYDTLVSNKHVLCNTDSIAISFTANKGNEPDVGNRVRLPISNIRDSIVGHPDSNVDIAVLECTGLFIMMPEQLYYKAVSYDMLATFNEEELSVAENVYFVGYPDNRYDNGQYKNLMTQSCIMTLMN